MKIAAKVTTTLILASLCSPSVPVTAGEENLTDLQNAKVAYEIAKQRMLSSQKTKEEREADRENDQSCGSIDIGNVRNQRGARAPREIVTVVRGDVINTGRCR